MCKGEHAPCWQDARCPVGEKRLLVERCGRTDGVGQIKGAMYVELFLVLRDVIVSRPSISSLSFGLSNTPW